MDSIQVNLITQEVEVPAVGSHNLNKMPDSNVSCAPETAIIQNSAENENNEGQFLLRKREAEVNADLSQIEKRERGSSVTEGPENSVLTCSICKKQNTSKLKTCKLCTLNFHLDCLLSTGECNFSEEFVCAQCRRVSNMRTNLLIPPSFPSEGVINNSKLSTHNDKNINGLQNFSTNQMSQINQTNFPLLNGNNYGNINPYLNFLPNQMSNLPTMQKEMNNYTSNTNLPPHVNNMPQGNINNQQASNLNNMTNMNNNILAFQMLQNMLKTDKNGNSNANANLLTQLLMKNVNGGGNLNLMGAILSQMNQQGNSHTNVNPQPQRQMTINPQMNQPNSAFGNPEPVQNTVTNVNFINNLINCVNYQNTHPGANNNLKQNTTRNNFPNFLNNPLHTLTNLASQNLNQNQTVNPKQNNPAMPHLKTLKDTLAYNAALMKGRMNEPSQIQRIVYPIEDTELQKDPDLHGIDIECFERPEFKALIIPITLQNKIITTWDYLLRFGKDFWASHTQYSEARSDIEKLYSFLIDTNSYFFKEIVLFLLTPFVSMCMSVDSEEFTTSKELLILKTVKENINTNYSVVSSRTWLDILKTVVHCNKFSLFADEKLKEICQIEESSLLSIEDKLKILLFLINSSFDLPKIKTCINSEMNKKSDLNKEKVYIQTEYRMKELRRKEIEQSDKFNNADNKIENLNLKLIDLEKKVNEMQPNQFAKKKKEILTEIERYKSLTKEHADIQIVKEKILTRLKEIKNEINSLPTTSKVQIGFDIYKNEFLFFESVNKLFIRETKNGKKSPEVKYYQDKEDIEELVSKLMDKGLREKKLKRNLMKIVNRLNTIENEKMDIDQEEEVNGANEKKENEDVKTSFVDFTPAVEILKKLDEKFTDYLTGFTKQWEDPSVRTEWKDTIVNFPTFGNLVQSLHMINLRFKNPYRSDEPAVSESEEIEKVKTQIPSFTFTKSDKTHLVIFEYDQTKVLAPKVKIWSKDLETYEIEKYYTENILNKINTPSQFFFALHFYESVIFTLMKRREAASKKNVNLIREINDIDILNECVMEKESQVDEGKEEGEQEQDQEKTVSVKEDLTESVNPSESVQSTEKKPKRKPKEKPAVNNLGHVRSYKRKRNQTGANNWSETCYICGEYGDLICCDGCPNVAHLFCVCLEKNPSEWFCEICIEKTEKIKKKGAK